MKRRPVIITGTGRAGTTFLVQLLTHLGLDTGFTPENMSKFINKNANAGLEHQFTQKDAPLPYIVKSPKLCDYIEKVLKSDVIIDHVFIPIRDAKAAAESRWHVTERKHKSLPLWKRFYYSFIRRVPKVTPGGLLDATRRQEQKLFYRKSFTNLF